MIKIHIMTTLKMIANTGGNKSDHCSTEGREEELDGLELPWE